MYNGRVVLCVTCYAPCVKGSALLLLCHFTACPLALLLLSRACLLVGQPGSVVIIVAMADICVRCRCLCLQKRNVFVCVLVAALMYHHVLMLFTVYVCV